MGKEATLFTKATLIAHKLITVAGLDRTFVEGVSINFPTWGQNNIQQIFRVCC
jgi:hypothetical protein